MAADSPLALVTGANRGIGFEVCRQLAGRGYTVLLAARDIAKGTAAAAGLGVSARELDVTSDESVRRLAANVDREFGRLDVLVNNAAINYDAHQKPFGTDLDYVRETLETNLFGVWRTCQAFAPLLKRSRAGRVVNVSSEAGSFGGGAAYALPGMGGAVPAYGVSKAALNALTVKLAAELAGTGVLVNAVCPGFTATYPGAAEQGARPVADGAAGVVWAATLPAGGPTGGFFRDGERLPW